MQFHLMVFDHGKIPGDVVADSRRVDHASRQCLGHDAPHSRTGAIRDKPTRDVDDYSSLG